MLSVCTTKAQTKKLIGKETPAQKAERLKWFKDARFGMFIHWGLYALPARHEWVKSRERMTNEAYQKYFNEFNPDLFDPKLWAKQAKAAGMKYAVLTSKHHEGFCLFDSKFTDYKATNTGAKRDLVKEFVDAFRAEGLKVGFYYSLLEWHHPDYTIDEKHPLRMSTAGDTASYYANANAGKHMANYQAYMKNQLSELLTNYGRIDILWADFSFPNNKGTGKGRDDWNSLELIKLIRKLQPHIIVNNRLDLDEYEDGGDFVTPEQVKPEALTKYRGQTWETCQTFSGSWGYYRDETSWKSHRQLLNLLITSVANGGNLILNVGPTARGQFDYRAQRALDSLAGWMGANSKSIYNCTFAPESCKLPEGLDARLTYNPGTGKLYVHLFTYPSSGKIILHGYKSKVSYAQFLNDGSELLMKASVDNNDVEIQLPLVKPLYEVPVIELTLVKERSK
jgi:alpha-L-fucosidase